MLSVIFDLTIIFLSDLKFKHQAYNVGFYIGLTLVFIVVKQYYCVCAAIKKSSFFNFQVLHYSFMLPITILQKSLTPQTVQSTKIPSFKSPSCNA